MNLRDAFETLIEAAVHAVVADLDQAATAHRSTREQGAALRHQAAARALFGPRMNEALTALIDEATRRSAKRFEQCLRHPRYSTDALVNEMVEAEATLGKEIVAAQGRASGMQTLSLAIALIRVEAIAMALGDTPVAGPAKRRGVAPSGTRLRRITAADIPDETAQAIYAAARGDDLAGVITGLSELEKSPVNAGAIVTKVKVALTQNGVRTARRLADDLREAGVMEVIPSQPTEAGPSDVDPVGSNDRPIMERAVGRAVPRSVTRLSMKDRVPVKHQGAPMRPGAIR